MNEPRIWVVVHDDETITAHQYRDQAINEARDDEHPWIEEVHLDQDTPWSQKGAQQPSEAPVGRFQPTDASAADGTPTRHAGAKRRSWVSPPSLSINGAWHDPWDGGSAA